MPLLLFLSTFFGLSHTRTQKRTEHFSVMWLAECKISSLQLEGNRFDKIPFSPRGAFKAQNGMAKAWHGTPGLSANQPTVDLHGPAALTSSQLASLTRTS